VSLWTIGNRTVTIKRQTASVLDAATAAATMSADRQPVQASCLQFTVSGGTTGSGTVTIAGTVGGSSDSEVLTFTANGVQCTVKQFTAIDSSGITTSGLADEGTVPTISAQAVGVDGSPQNTSYNIVTGRPAQFDYGGGPMGHGWEARNPGANVTGGAAIMMAIEDIWSPRVGDLITDDQSETWLVQGFEKKQDRFVPTHWEMIVSRYDA
jgi:hypothetical protein